MNHKKAPQPGGDCGAGWKQVGEYLHSVITPGEG